MSQLLLSDLDGFIPDNALSTLLKSNRGGTIRQAELLVRPDGLNRGSVGHSDTSAAAGGLPLPNTLQAKSIENVVNRGDKVGNLLGSVTGSGSDTQALLTNRDSGIVDGLNVDLVLGEKHVGSLLGEGCVTDKYRDDVRGVGHDRDVKLVELTLDFTGVELLETTVSHELSLVSDGRLSTGDDGRRKRSGEDEARGVRPNDIDKVGRTGNVTTNNTVGFTKSGSNDIDSVHDAALHGLRGVTGGVVSLKVKVFSNTSTVGTVHADGMHFIKECEGAVFVCKITDSFDGSDTTAHGVDTLKSNDLGNFFGYSLELGLKVSQVIVLPDDLFSARVADTLDHRSVVACVGEDDTAGKLGTDGGKAGIIGDVARRKHKGGFFSVERSYLVFKGEMKGAVTGNVPCTTSTGAITVKSTSVRS